MPKRSLKLYPMGDIDFDPGRSIGGRFSDNFKGVHLMEGFLALKLLKTRSAATSKEQQDACLKLATTFRQLSHPNVHEFYGIHLHSWKNVYLVSPWAAEGSVIDYVAKYPDADRPTLLGDVVKGLSYLHHNGIAHGALKGTNALVTAKKRVVICAFGLHYMSSVLNATAGEWGMTRWQSPELMRGGPRTFQADVYAFGIMVYEILSGKVPFANHASNEVIMAVLDRGERPPRDPLKSSMGKPFADYWRIAEICWAKASEHRPTMVEVVSKWPLSEIEQVQRLREMMKNVSSRYEECRAPSDLDGAITLSREILAFHLPGHPERAFSLHTLATYLNNRYTGAGEASDLEEAIMLQREVVQLHPLGHQIRARSLHKLAFYLNERFTLVQNLPDLEEAITFMREAIELRPPGDPNRVVSLRNLGIYLHMQYALTHDGSDLDDAIETMQEAVDLRPSGDQDRASSLHSLADDLYSRYALARSVSDLRRAIALQREAVELRPPGNPNRAVSLSNLGVCLGTLYAAARSAPDLDEAITLMREAVELRPPGNQDRAGYLRNLGIFLSNRYDLARDASDLEEAIVFMQEAVELYPPGHHRHAASFQRLTGYIARLQETKFRR